MYWLHIWIPTKEYEINELRGRELGKSFEEKTHKIGDNEKKIYSEEGGDGNIQFHVTPVKADTKSKPKVTLNVTFDKPQDPPPSSSVPIVETFEENLTKLLSSDLDISRYTKELSADAKHILITFQVEAERVEKDLVTLNQRGFGVNDFTSVSVVSSCINFPSSAPVVKRSSSKEKFDDKVKKFYDSIKSRLMVAEVVSSIRAGNEFNFDYIMLVILAGILAFLGLLEDSSVVLVASMLVSPIMGPILAGIFGFVIRDYYLTRKGIRNEIISLLICIIIGFFLGFIVTLCISYNIYSVQHFWPTEEMLSRGELRGLYTGALIAIPSGAGVALSVLGGNAGSLVGVAISASLLSPAVNAGMFWAMAAISALSEDRDIFRYTKGWKTFVSDELGCPLKENGTEITNFDTYYYSYSCLFEVEAFCLGLASLALTIVNIFCIIITGFAILRLKEVTPEKIPQKFSRFWKHDVGTYRKSLKSLKKSGKGDKDLITEIRDMVIGKQPENEETDFDESQSEGAFIKKIFSQAYNDDSYLNIMRWVPFPPVPTTNPRVDPVSQRKRSTGDEFLQKAKESYALQSSLQIVSGRKKLPSTNFAKPIVTE